MIKVEPSATAAWLKILERILSHGVNVSPRGYPTYEILHNSIAFDMHLPVVNVSARKLSYKFLAAEALWILHGDNSVAGISPYNKNISQFSDNGRTFNGAYGPQIQFQLGHVVNSLRQDPMSRQAVLTIWRPNPPKSKDIPCTVSLAFNIRDNKLNCHAFMRSSDAWLGVPYDFFNFSMVACQVLHQLNDPTLDLGCLYWTGVSSHLYDPQLGVAREIIDHPQSGLDSIVPTGLWLDWDNFEADLVACRDNTPHATWKIRP